MPIFTLFLHEYRLFLTKIAFMLLFGLIFEFRNSSSPDFTLQSVHEMNLKKTMRQKRKTQKNRKSESLRSFVSDENKAEGISIEYFPLQTDCITDDVFKNETVRIKSSSAANSLDNSARYIKSSSAANSLGNAARYIKSSSAANSLGNAARYIKSSSAANRSRSYADPEANAS